MLIYLERIGLLGLLPGIYGNVLIPEAVWSELARGSLAVVAGPPPWLAVGVVADRRLVSELGAELDAGESEAIALALEQRADLLLIDEQMGREAATRLGIKITGLLGVLVIAKHRGMLPSVEPQIRALRAVDFWLSDELVERILRQVGE